MEEEEKRKEFIAFRISSQRKKWLADLVEDSNFDSQSDYLNNLIGFMRRCLILKNAMNASKLTVWEKFGLPEKMSEKVDGPEDIIALFKALSNEEEARKFNEYWLNELKQNVKKDAGDKDIQFTVDCLSTDRGNALIEHFFIEYFKNKELYPLLNDEDAFTYIPKKGRKK
jgi:Arc/MetJ-type ribon-helix-helix transcriptional regulator